MSSFYLQVLTQNADRISVQSSVKPTWTPQRRMFSSSMMPKRHDIAMTRDEVLILKTRGTNTIRIKGTGNEHGNIIIRSTRGPTRTLAKGQSITIELADDETLTLRTESAQNPLRTPSVQGI